MVLDKQELNRIIVWIASHSFFCLYIDNDDDDKDADADNDCEADKYPNSVRIMFPAFLKYVFSLKPLVKKCSYLLWCSLVRLSTHIPCVELGLPSTLSIMSS